MTSRLCCRIDCEGNVIAEWRPFVELRPKGYEGEPVKMFFGHAVCSACKSCMVNLGAECLLSDEGWEMILSVMASNQLAKPHRSSSTIGFEHATDATDPSKIGRI